MIGSLVSSKNSQRLNSVEDARLHSRLGFQVSLRLFLCLPIGSAPAQTFYGSILGTVTDTSGGVIAGANVTLTNLGTSARKTAVADAATTGSWNWCRPLPHRRRIARLQTPHPDQILMEVQSTIRIAAPVEVGDTRQVVEVQALTPLLQSESATTVPSTRKSRET